MIPLRDQEILRERFQRELTSRVRIDYFTQRRSPLYVAGREACAYCEETRTLLEEMAALGERIALTVHELSEATKLAAELGVDRAPGIVIRGQANRPVRFFGIPSGNEFPGFVETLIDAARGSVDLKPETVKQLRKIKSDVRVRVFVTPTCPYCPALARTAHKLALQSPRVKVDVIEISEFPTLSQRYGIRAVPTTVIGDKVLLPGAMDETVLLQSIMRVAEGKTIATGESKPGSSSALPSPQAGQTSGAGLILPR